MRLEVHSYPVREVVLGDRTALDGAVLHVDAAAARALILEEAAITDVALHVARPGDATRIVHALDVAQPRLKISGSPDYPGFLSPNATAGEGVAHRLTGMAIVETGPPIGDEPLWWREAIIDMSGPGAPYCPFAETINLVLDAQPAAGVTWANFNKSVRRAGLRLGGWLTATTRALAPASTRVYELPEVDPSLPRVAYVYVLYSPYLYGEHEEHLLPTIAHPNELLDGMLVNSRNGPASARPATYLETNNPVVESLYARHGRDLAFVGAMLTSGHDPALESKRRIAAWMVKLAQMLRLHGAVLMYPSSGHSYVTLMLLCQELERAGVQTSMLHMEMAATPEDSGFVYSVPEAQAIVSTGNMEELLHLPPMERVIGGDTLFESYQPAGGPLEVTLRHLYGATNQFGSNRLAGRAF